MIDSTHSMILTFDLPYKKTFEQFVNLLKTNK